MSEHSSETSFEGDDTCSFEDVLLQSGDSTDSKGKKVTLTSDDVRQAYANIMKRENHSIPYYAIHDGEEVARILKYKLVEDQGNVKILSKGVVHNPKSYYDRYSRGFIHTSPELLIHSDDATNKVIMVDITGAAMSKSPGMNPEVAVTRHMNFSLDEPEKIEVNKTSEDTFDWKVPLTNLESKVDSITSAIKEMAAAKDTKVEPKMTEEPKPDMTQITELMSSMKEEIAQLKAEKAQATAPVTTPTTPVVEEVKTPELDEKLIETIPKEFLETYTTSLAELEALKQENRAFKEEKEKQAKQAYSDVLQKCRDLGIENPEKFVASNNLNTEQKTAMLSAFAAEFVKKTPLNTSQTESITNQGNELVSEDDSLITAMQRLGIKKPSQKFMDAAIATGLYDKSGKWVGDSPSGYA